MADLSSGAYGPPIPTGPTTPSKPFAQQLEESYFAGSKPSQDELAGFRNFLSLVQQSGKSNQQIEAEFQGLKNTGMDFAGTLGADYYQNKLTQQLANQRKNLGTDKYYKGSIDSMGGMDTATQYMASLLTRSGIRDLSEIKEVTETKPVYGFPSDIPFKREEDGNPKIVRPEEGGQFYEVVIGPNPEGGEYTQLVPVESIPQVQTGSNTYTKLINSRTGEQLKQGHDASYIYANTQNSYVDGKPDSEYTIGGSFAGGNTSLKLRMVDGLPVFYSTPGPSSSDFPKEAVAFGLAMASFAVPGLGAAVGGSITGALGITASAAVNAAIGTGVLTTLASGGDVKKGVISGLTSFVAPAIAAEIGNAAGNIFDSPVGAKMFANMSAAAIRTAALGGNSDDIGKAVLGTATGEMFNVVASQIPGFSDIKDSATKAAISSSIQAALSTPGDLSEKAQAAMLQGSITMGLSELEVDGKKFNELPPAQQSIARQALTSALTGQPLNEKAILNTALSAASKEVQAAIKAEQTPSAESKTEPQPDLAAFDASVGLTKPAAPLEEDTGFAASPDDVGFAVGSDFVVPGAAPPDEVLTAEAPSAGPMPSGLAASQAEYRFSPGMGGITDVLSPTGEIAQLGEDVLGQGIATPTAYQTPFTEYASAATSDVPAQDISISNLPESMRPREGEIVTDATYGPEGEVRVTMVGKRPDGTEYSYTAVQDPEDKSVFYETASGGEAGGTTSSSDTRPGVEEKPADNIVIKGENGSAVTLSPDGSVIDVTDSDGMMPDNASDAQKVIDGVFANPVDITGSQEIPLTESQKIAAGFPSAALYDLYSGDVARYQQDEAEYAGFPDWKKYTEYAGDSKAYQNDLAVADGWPDADTRDEFKNSKERYAQHLADERDLLERGRLYDLEQAAIKAGFPDYATQQKFESNYDAYQKSLLPPVVEPPIVESPVGAVESGTGTVITEGGAGNDTPIAGAGTDTLDGGAGTDAKVTGETQAGTIVITGEDGSSVTLGPNGSVVDVTDAEGNQPSNVQDVVANVISNPVNIETVEGAGGADITGGEAGEDTAQGAESDAATGETKTGNIVITGENGSTVTLSPDGSVVDATDPDGSTSNDVQDVFERVIANPVNIDTLEGAPGNDTFVGGEGDNTLVGGEGNDTFVIGGDDTLIGGEGNDTFVGDGEDTLDGGVATTEGGEGNDTLFGAVGNDTFTAEGDDSLDGGTGNDTLEGDADEDILDKLFGDDTFIGGDGNDTVTYDDTLDGGEGNDTLEGGEGNDTVTDVETLEGGDGNDSLDGDKEVEPEPTFTCPEGFTYDYELGVCMPDIPVEEEPQEPDIIPTCKEGFTYDYELGVCVPDIAKPPEVIECEEGYVYDPVQGICVPEVTEPPKPEVIECEEGYVYDPVQGICVPETIVTPPVVTPPVVTPPKPQPPPPQPPPPPPPPKCPPGYVYDAKLKQCVPISRDLPLGLTPDQFSALFGAQQTAMGPKFEAFYANIPGYKPFDLRQFSSDFYDEE